jgi:antirestriction protein ArdC
MPRGEYESRGSQEAAQDRVRQAVEQLEEGLDGILAGEQYAAFLRTLARFHSYSFGNVLLIQIQRPDSIRVAGFRTWQSLGRQVRKGETGIKILVPHISRRKTSGEEQRIEDERESEDEPLRGPGIIRGFGVGTVFDVSQTDGPPLPEPPPVELVDGASEVGMRLYVDLVDSLAEQGIPVQRAETGRANGSFDPLRKRIAIGFHIDGDQATKTLTHEAAHAVAGHTAGMNSQDVETVAESAAYVVLNHYGIDSSGYSFGYVASWAQDKAVFKRNLAAIQETSHTIISALEPGQGRSPRSAAPASMAPRVIFEA